MILKKIVSMGINLNSFVGPINKMYSELKVSDLDISVGGVSQRWQKRERERDFGDFR